MEQVKGNRGKQWMVVYTRPKNEKKVAERLEQLELEIYCPLQTTVRQWSDRKKKVKIPVIPSYVFLKIAEADRKIVLEDPGVVRFIFWLGKPAIIPDREIELLRQFLENLTDVKIVNIDLKPGNKVTIKEGPLKNEKGEIIEVGSKYATITLSGLGIQLKAKVRYNQIQLE